MHPVDKLSHLHRWILKAAAAAPDGLPKVRIMSDYFQLPTRPYGLYGDLYNRIVVDRQSIDPATYRDAAGSMNRSLKRLQARGLVTNRYAHHSDDRIVLTEAGQEAAAFIKANEPEMVRWGLWKK
jgi:hypothetical protein